MTQLTVGKVTSKISDLVTVAELLVKPWKDARVAHAIIRQVMQSRPEDEPKLTRELRHTLGAKQKASIKADSAQPLPQARRR